MKYTVKNWAKFQHYKSGRGAPPWIKLYRELLNDKEWFALDPGAAKFLISAWLLAAEDNGNLPDSETIAFRLRLDSKLLAKYLTLCSHWILSDASNVLADCYQLATPDTETDTETDTDIGAKKSAKKKLIDLGVSEQAAADWLTVRKAKRAPLTDTVLSSLVTESSKAGLSVNEAVQLCAERSWQGFKASYLNGTETTQPNRVDA